MEPIYIFLCVALLVYLSFVVVIIGPVNLLRLRGNIRRQLDWRALNTICCEVG